MNQTVPFPTHDEAPNFAVNEVPYNQEMEQSVLGALLADNRIYEKIGDFLKAEHFYMPAHQRIYAACITLIERGQVASPLTLKGYFLKDEDLQAIGGGEYLATLAGNILSLVNVDDHARVLYDLFLRRALIGLGTDIIGNASKLQLEEEATDVIEKAEGELFRLAESGDTKSGFVTFKESLSTALVVAETALKTKDGLSGVTSGLRDMDKLLGGMHNSDLIILAGRPSMGKTALATNIAFNAAKAYSQIGAEPGAIVAFFSLEMSHDQLTTRILAEQARVSGDALRKGQLHKDEFQNFAEVAHNLMHIPLYIDDTPALSIGAVRARARRLKRQHGLGMIVIDYLQLLRGSGSRQSESNRVNEVSEITRGLKALAKELHVPVLALSQLSRAVEQREDKRPQLSDLRESGSIEQDADVVMFVYREEYYVAREKPGDDDPKMEEWQRKMDRVHNVAEAIVAKQRHGPIGIVPMQFDPNFTRFSDLETRYESSAVEY